MRDTPTRNRRNRRWLAGLLSAAVASAALLVPSTAQAATDDAGARDAAVFLGRQLEANNYRMPGGSGAADWGLTIDAVFALSSAGVGKDIVEATVEAMQSDDFTYLDNQNANNMGAFAKTALALQIAGEDPTNFHGQDLIALLRSKVQASGKVGTNSNHFGQALAVLALARTPEGVPQHVVDYTLGYQCRTAGHANFGGFSFLNGANACNGVDGDAVGMLGSALLAVRGQLDPQVMTDAQTWLADHQLTDGSFATSWSGAGNTNSAGLVAQFARQLGTPGAREIAGNTHHYLAGLSVGCSHPFAFGATSVTTGGGYWTQWRGAIAYNRTALDAGSGPGVATGLQDQWRRASAQAVLGMNGMAGFSELSTQGMTADLPELSTCALTGSAPTITGSSEIGGTLSAVPGAYRSNDVAHTGAPSMTWQWFRDGFAIPGATEAHYTVTTADAGEPISARATTTEPGFVQAVSTSQPVVGGELPAGTFAVTGTTSQVRHGTTTSIVVTGLAPHETYTVTLGGVPLATGSADDAGEIHRTVTVPHGTPTDQHRSLLVTGRAPGRTGTTTLYTVGAATLTVNVPTRPAHRGTTARITASGLLPEEKWTARVSGTTLASGTASATGVATARVKIPTSWRTQASRSVVVTGAWGDRIGRGSLATTAPATLGLKLGRTTPKKGATQRATVSKLLPGEAVRVKVAGRTVRTGRANSKGIFTVTFNVGKAAGTRKVTATGGSATRRATKTYRVR